MGRQVLRPGSETRPRREMEHWSRVAALVRVMREVARRAKEDVENFIVEGMRGMRMLRKGVGKVCVGGDGRRGRGR